MIEARYFSRTAPESLIPAAVTLISAIFPVHEAVLTACQEQGESKQVNHTDHGHNPSSGGAARDNVVRWDRVALNTIRPVTTDDIESGQTDTGRRGGYRSNDIEDDGVIEEFFWTADGWDWRGETEYI